VPPITWRGWESDRRRLPGVAGRVWRPSTTTVNFARRRNVGRCPAPVRSFSVLQKRAAAGALPSKLSGPMIYYFMVVPSWRRNVEDDGEHSRIRIIRFAERLLRVAVTYGRLPAFLAPSTKRISSIQSKRNQGKATQCNAQAAVSVGVALIGHWHRGTVGSCIYNLWWYQIGDGMYDG